MRAQKVMVCLVVLVSIVPRVVLAQASIKTFVSADGSFSFIYPADWDLKLPVSNLGPLTDRITLSNLPTEASPESPSGIQIQIALPQKKAFYALTNGNMTPSALVRASVASGKLAAPITFGTPPADGTPELLDLQPVEAAITEFSVNGYPAASIIDQNIRFSLETCLMLVVIDVGNDDLVAVWVNSAKAGIDVVKANEGLILAIVQSIRYAPKAVYSGNPDLPQVYSGPIGVWQRGTGRFYYPANWIVFTFASQIIQNSPDHVDLNAPKSGQMIAVIEGPAELQAGFNIGALLDLCSTQHLNLTASALAEKILKTYSDRLAQAKDTSVTLSQAASTTINAKPIAYFYLSQADFENLIILVDPGQDNILAIMAIARKDEMRQFEKQLLGIAGTFEYVPNPCQNGSLPMLPTATPGK